MTKKLIGTTINTGEEIKQFQTTLRPNDSFEYNGILKNIKMTNKTNNTLVVQVDFTSRTSEIEYYILDDAEEE